VYYSYRKSNGKERLLKYNGYECLGGLEKVSSSMCRFYHDMV